MTLKLKAVLYILGTLPKSNHGITVILSFLQCWRISSLTLSMPEWLSVIILGIVEGITEFLPVSSTGHLLIAQHWLQRQSDLFDIVIQSGAVIAVLPLFPERFHQIIYKWRERSTWEYFGKLMLAFVITGAIGFVLDKKGFKLPETMKPIAIALLVGGVLFVVIERWLKGRHTAADVTWAMAVVAGLGQIVAAVFPGASRSGTTILALLGLGLSRGVATEFSFLLGVPTMLAAGGHKILKQLTHAQPGAAPEHWGMVVLGFVVSAIVSFIVVKWLLRYVQTHTFEAFGWYRIILALGLLCCLA